MKNSSLKPDRANILITGADGFIGAELSAYLKNKYKLFNVVYKMPLADAGDSIKLDLRNKAAIKSYFKEFRRKHRIHIILHLASRLASANRSEDLSILYDNIRITEGLTEIARLIKPKKIINFY